MDNDDNADPSDRLRSLDWNIQDAKDALACAVDMGNWDGVIKYANQLKSLESQRFTLTSPAPFTTGQWNRAPINTSSAR
jgi:hypothetical protein